MDLAPDEAGTDSAADTLSDTGALGTAGWWCALRGESVPGMGHLAPLLDLRHLRQASSFAAAGAPGWHPETLARRGGLEGLNRKNVYTAAGE